MTDRPILFSGPMVRALLGGRKSQTRRIIKDRGCLPEFCGGRYDDRNDPEVWGWQDFERGEWITLDQFRRYRFVPYSPGDRLWVREACHIDGDQVSFRADMPEGCDTSGWGWRPSIHMPRWVSRLTLTVTDVRVQRVQEISGEDCIAEGVTCETCAASWSVGRGACNQRGCFEIKQNFRSLWDSLNAKRGYGWGANPWVAAYTFTVHRQNIDQMEASR